MGPEPQLDYVSILRGLAERSIRYVVIGGQAVLLHGVPLFSFDFDVWVDPASRRQVLEWLALNDDFELSAGSDDATPIVRVYAGRERMDLFFIRAMTNREGVTIAFDDLIARAELRSDPEAGLAAVPIPSLDDLIALKRMASTPRPKDEEAIRHLLAKKLLRASGEAQPTGGGGDRAKPDEKAGPRQ